ncbi:hypothetical protein D3C81_1447120 [compost metagenome]
MWIDEAGHQGVASQVDQQSLGALVLHDLIAISDGENTAVLDCNCLSLWLKLIDGDDVTTCVDGIGRGIRPSLRLRLQRVRDN